MAAAKGKSFDSGRSRSRENVSLSMWFPSFEFERTDLLSFAVLQNQINLTNRLKPSCNLDRVGP